MMKTQKELQAEQLAAYTRINTEQGLGKAPLYFVTSTELIPSGKRVFYFRVLSEAVVTFENGFGGTNATAKTIAAGEEFWGDFSVLTVASGELLAYSN